jgi:CheY-like chemotaxis protein/anti-sigma regulatory factor (Ser/Thr protein kinase)
MLTAGRHLLMLISDVLDLSKIEAGRVDVKIAPLDLAEPVAQACGLLADSARKANVRLENRVATRAVVAVADPDKVRQVLLNLLSNAVKFTPAGGAVTVDATVQGERVRVEVRDTGIGIAAEDIPRFFQPFSQLDTGDARRFAGTGLGLSISKRLVELMSGEIGVESEPGKGSTFWFTLPVSVETQADASAAASPRLRSYRPASPTRGTPDAPPLVLVVEDAEPDARVIEASLTRAGYAVRVVRTGAEALRALEATTPGLMIVDLGLPDLSGAALVEQIRGRAALAEVPIVVLTARDLTSEEQAHFATQVDMVAQKGSVSRTDFLAEIAALCPPPRREPSAPLRVLVVDDSELNRRVLRAMLEAARCEVLEAPDAATGLRLAREQRPAVVLMDLQMPGTGGLAATRTLADDPATAGIPVIAVTAHAMTDNQERARAAGCVGYVTKPVARAELYAAIGRAIGQPGWGP